MSKIFFDKIPVLKVSEEQNLLYQQLVNDIQKEYTDEKAIAIDQLIFDIYKLSPEERETIGFIQIQ